MAALSDAKKERIADAARAIMEMCAWGETPHGSTFWALVYNELMWLTTWDGSATQWNAHVRSVKGDSPEVDKDVGS